MIYGLFLAFNWVINPGLDSLTDAFTTPVILAAIALWLGFFLFVRWSSPGLMGGLRFLMGREPYAYMGKQKFIEKIDNDTYSIFKLTAPCIHRGCDEGKIVVVDAPPKEVPNLEKPYVGICSLCGRDHSYRIDHNFIATQERFDWSEPEPNPPASSR